MRKGVKYILLVIVFTVLVVGMTVSKLFVSYDEKGVFEYNNKYGEIVFSNVIINGSNDSSVKIDNINNSLHIQIPNLKDEYTFSVDLQNIGNINMKVKNFSYSNIVSNIDINNIEIISSIKEGDYINGSESKKLIVKVKSSKNKNEEIYCNFNINYLFEEVNL